MKITTGLLIIGTLIAVVYFLGKYIDKKAAQIAAQP